MPARPPRTSLHRKAVVRKPSELEMETYKMLATLFNSEETAFWTRNNILVALQAALVAATVAMLTKLAELSALSPSGQVLRGAIGALCFVGLASALAWLFMVRRSTFIADTISKQLKALEARLEQDYSVRAMKPEFKIFTSFGDALSKDGKFRRLEAHRLSTIWTIVGTMFVLIWIALSYANLLPLLLELLDELF